MRIQDFNRALAPLWRRVVGGFSRGTLNLVGKEDGTQRVQGVLFKGEVRNNLERPQLYGFTSTPVAGCELFVLFVGGDRSHGIVVADGDPRYRPKDLQPGEACLYNLDGTRIVLRRGGLVEITAAGQVHVKAPLVHVDGDVVAGGDVSDGAGSLQDLRDLYDVHIHPEHDGGSTGPPTPQA